MGTPDLGMGTSDLANPQQPADMAMNNVQPANFTTANYAAGSGPSDIVTADFNGDQIPDVAVTDEFDNTVSVLLGKGDGTLLAAHAFATGTTPMFMATGLINGDSIVDIVTVSTGDGSVAVLLGNGDGTFGPAAKTVVSTKPSGIAIADFNGDGKRDIAVGDDVTANIVVLPGNGDGTLKAPVTSALVDLPYTLEATDFDSNGVADLVVGIDNSAVPSGQPANAVAVLRGKGDGTFSRAAVSQNTSGHIVVKMGDIDGNSHLDVVTAQKESSFVGISHLNADGTLTWLVNCGCANHPAMAIVEPLAGPGTANLLMVSLSDGSMLADVAQRMGGVTVVNNVAVGSLPSALVAADLNKDGSKDVIVANNGTNNVTVLLYGP